MVYLHIMPGFVEPFLRTAVLRESVTPSTTRSGYSTGARGLSSRLLLSLLSTTLLPLSTVAERLCKPGVALHVQAEDMFTASPGMRLRFAPVVHSRLPSM